MKIDYHIHLEEGPYSFRWLDRTAEAISFFSENEMERGTRAYVQQQLVLLNERLQHGCYSEEWLDLYLMRAKQLGLQEVGIVDHLYRFKETELYFKKNLILDENDSIGRLQMDWLQKVMTETMESFVEAIVAAKPKWAAEGVKLRLGLEADYFVGAEEELSALIAQYPWDYVIGSVHFIDGWGFDNPETANRFEQVNLKELYDRFFFTVEKSIYSGLFDFIAHLDNVKVFNYQLQDEAFMHSWYERIADALIKMNIATEVNAGLYYRYPVNEMCPGKGFLNILVEKGVDFTLSSDAHFPDDVGNYTEANATTLKQLGVQQLVTFHQRQKMYVGLS